MSGKKSSQVYSVLNRLNGDLDDRIQNEKKQLETVNGKINYSIVRFDSVKKNATELHIGDYPHANDRFSSELEKSQKKFHEYIGQLKNFSTKTSQYDTQGIETTIADFKKRGDQIRQSVRGYDYADNEYRSAIALQKELNTYLNQLKNECRDLNKDIDQNNQTIMQMQKLVDQAKAELNKMHALEKEAIFLKEQKDKAHGLRKQISEMLQDFDTNILDKYVRLNDMKSEYLVLAKDAESFLQSDDKIIIENYSRVRDKLTGLQADIIKRIEVLDKDKEELRRLIEEYDMESSVKAYKDPQKGELYDIFSYVQKYELEGVNTEKIKILSKNIQELEKKEHFFEAIELQQERQKLYHQAIEVAIAEQERMRTNVLNTMKLRDAMKDMAYGVEVKAISESKNPKDGYKVTAMLGNDVIEFMSTVDESGETDIAINHLDKNRNDATNCEKSWSEIRNKLVESGLYMHDVTKNGKSVIVEKSTSDKSMVQVDKNEKQRTSTG